MTLEMLKKDTYDSGFTAGEEYGRKEGISIGRNEGIAIGEERGISIGLLQGEHKKAVETAKIMLLKNISFEIISECTGLSPEEIEKL